MRERERVREMNSRHTNEQNRETNEQSRTPLDRRRQTEILFRHISTLRLILASDQEVIKLFLNKPTNQHSLRL